MYLLKQKAKAIQPKKKRKVVPLLGSIQDYHLAQQNANLNSQNQEEEESVADIEKNVKKSNEMDEDF